MNRIELMEYVLRNRKHSAFISNPNARPMTAFLIFGIDVLWEI